jgi:hypothetical protein
MSEDPWDDWETAADAGVKINTSVNNKSVIIDRN